MIGCAPATKKPDPRDSTSCFSMCAGSRNHALTATAARREAMLYCSTTTTAGKRRTMRLKLENCHKETKQKRELGAC